MYTIRQASIRSGVNVPLIRAWERRYGVVSPSRTAAGYRLYDDEAIATVLGRGGEVVHVPAAATRGDPIGRAIVDSVVAERLAAALWQRVTADDKAP